jgi:hypothetical protein
MSRKKKTTTSKTTRRKSIRIPVDKPFADGTISNSVFFSMIRSALRNKSRFWPSIKICRERARLPYTGASKRRKWMYRCEMCDGTFPVESTVVHHTISCGALSSFDDLPIFTKNLFCNSNLLQLLCNQCHTNLHENEKVK